MSASHRPAVPVLLAVLIAGIPADASGQVRDAAPAEIPPTFRHAEHESVECAACHRMDPEHGAFLVRSIQDCRSCHHSEPVRRDCVSCHSGDEIRTPTHHLRRTLSVTAAPFPSERELPFRHGDHEAVECADCHSGGPSLGVPDLDCRSCHEEHHAPETSCFQCHLEPAEPDHGRSVHATCSGAGCHEEVPVEEPPRTRSGCLWCHGDQAADHYAARECVRCHLMPPIPGPGRGPER